MEQQQPDQEYLETNAFEKDDDDDDEEEEEEEELGQILPAISPISTSSTASSSALSTTSSGISSNDNQSKSTTPIHHLLTDNSKIECSTNTTSTTTNNNNNNSCNNNLNNSNEVINDNENGNDELYNSNNIRCNNNRAVVSSGDEQIVPNESDNNIENYRRWSRPASASFTSSSMSCRTNKRDSYYNNGNTSNKHYRSKHRMSSIDRLETTRYRGREHGKKHISLDDEIQIESDSSLLVDCRRRSNNIINNNNGSYCTSFNNRNYYSDQPTNRRKSEENPHHNHHPTSSTTGSNIVSILKRKDSSTSSNTSLVEWSTSSNGVNVTFSPSVIDTETTSSGTSSRQGILKKRSSLDESRYSRSHSPSSASSDEKGCLVKINRRRNSSEEIHHGILKQKSYDSSGGGSAGGYSSGIGGSSGGYNTPNSSVHAVMRMVTADFDKTKIIDESDEMYNIKPILKSDNEHYHNQKTTMKRPKPILKKNHSSDNEEIRSILKSRKSSLASSQTVNYCDSTLCRAGVVNIGCNNDGAFATNCLFPAQVDIVPLQSMFLDTLNRIRNTVAAGSLFPLPPAVRMPSVAWSTDLAYTAELNSKKCKFTTDCHNSPEFRMSGQSKYQYESTMKASPQFVIESALNSWYARHENTTASDISKYLVERSMIIGTFTPLIGDKTNKIGCAMVYQLKRKVHSFFLSCNFASTNIGDAPVYVSGPTATGCTSGVNPAYPALCSQNEVM
ncbi:unnamed protein product [Diamesa serratosioi]